MKEALKRLRFNADGLIPAVIQDEKSREVLTLCYMNEEALRKTLDEKFVFVFRRSQNRLMQKGEQSGHTQEVVSLGVDCEGKSVLIKVHQKIAACHKGFFSCYFESLKNGDWVLNAKKAFDPEKTYKK